MPWERGLISRCHAGWVSGRDCLLEFVTRPTKLHMLARLATWTVHGEYRGLRAAHGLARLATWTVHGEYRCPRAAHGHPRVHRRRTRDAFVSHMEHGALCPAGRVPLQAGRPAIAECTRCLTARCRQARPGSSPIIPPGEQHLTCPWPSARAYALPQQVRRRRFAGKSADSGSVCHAPPAATRPVWVTRAGPPPGGPVRSSPERKA